MNLFLTRLTGKLMTTEKFEKHIRQLLIDAKRYHEIEKSDMLKEVRELEKAVSDPHFQAKKKEYQTKKYKDTGEYKNYESYQKSLKDKEVKAYMPATTDEEREKHAGAIAVTDYLQLKGIVEEQGFETRRLFWKDKNRWLQTEEYKQEARLEEMKKSDDMKFFFNAPIARIKAMEEWHETFIAPFHETSREKNHFQAGFWFKNPNLKRDFTPMDSALAYMGEKNISIQDDIL